ncbi:cytochrome P450 [Clostridium acetobutylicum]|nr:cytochrome P450 [Clostridium acetobutylicum]
MLLKENTAKDRGIDSTLDLLKEGYLFIKNRADHYQADLFETRLMGQRVICMTGEEAARIFYDSDKFQRQGAAPKRVQETLLGENAIQTLDGEAHIHRKKLFMLLTSQVQQKRLAELTMERWEASASKWHNKSIILFNEANEILCEVACHWAGVPLMELDIKSRAEDFSSMIDAFGAVGPRHWKGKKARNRTEAWIKEIIENVRSGRIRAEEGSPLHEIAFYIDVNGKQMPAEMAAIELINILRPIVAISTFIIFSALALYEHSEYREKLQSKDIRYLEMFTQEVRRYYPFAPFVGARVRKDFLWNNCEFKKEMLVLLDIYGTDHDSRIWQKPYEFIPDRFRSYKGNLFDFIPQGGGDTSITHRCPGEGITLEIMKASLDFLSTKIDFTVPDQDLSYSLSKIPTLPKSGFIIDNVNLKL